jgi:propanol-preferring alcohol dehydrogenase
MKAMVVPQWGEKSVLMNRPDPKPSPREAVMRVRAAGVGLTLLNMRNGSFGGEAPRIMGHELAGDIVEVVRHSDVAGSQPYYRYCVPDVNVA